MGMKGGTLASGVAETVHDRGRDDPDHGAARGLHGEAGWRMAIPLAVRGSNAEPVKATRWLVTAIPSVGMISVALVVLGRRTPRVEVRRLFRLPGFVAGFVTTLGRATSGWPQCIVLIVIGLWRAGILRG
jgi:hypothetical protein